MEQATLNPAPTRRLVRGDGPIAGVAAGLADYFEVDEVLVRLGLVVTGIAVFPTVPIAYLAAWLIIPKAATPPAPPMPGMSPVPPAASQPPAPSVPPAPPAPVATVQEDPAP